MADRRIEALTTLERVAGQALESEAAGLSALRARIGALEAERRNISHRLEHETHVTSIETAAYIGDFVRAMRHRDKILLGELQKLEAKAALLQDKVLALYHEEQRAAQGREKLVTEARSEADRRAEAVTGEQALIRWQRARR